MTNPPTDPGAACGNVSSTTKASLLEARRQHIFQQMQELYDISKKVNTDANLMLRFKIRIQFVSQIRTEFIEVVNQLNEARLAENPKYTPSFKAIDSFDELFYYTLAVNQKMLDLEKSSPSVTADIKLPHIDLPKFSGVDLKQWPIFYELFNRLVHENKKLSDAERVHYLITHLSGTALAVCSELPPTSANYGTLYTALKNRYQDSLLLACFYFDKMLSFKPLTSESESGLNSFLESFYEPSNGLMQLECDTADFMITQLALKRLDLETRRQFEMANRSNRFPSYKDLIKFVQGQAKIVGRLNVSQKSSSSNQSFKSAGSSQKGHYTNNTIKNAKVNSFVAQTENTKQHAPCIACNKNPPHPFISCTVFESLSPNERFKLVKRHDLCVNCFDKHKTHNCTSEVTCSICRRKHHTKLHFPDNRSSNVPSTQHPSSSHSSKSSEASKIEQINVALCNSSPVRTFSVLMSTARVGAVDGGGRKVILRALLDCGSEASFLTSNACRKLGLRVSDHIATVRGIGSSIKTISGTTQLTIFSTVDDSCKYDVRAWVIEDLTGLIPSAPIQLNNLKFIEGLVMADPEFHTPQKIDLLLGADMFPLLLGSRKIVGPAGTPTAVETSLGFVLMGKLETVPDPIMDAPQVQSFVCSLVEPSMDDLVKNLWSLEEVPAVKPIHPDDKMCEKIFMESTRQGEDGKFTVELPFKFEPSLLGNSFDSSYRKFMSLERKLIANPELCSRYSEIIQGYLDQDHMSLSSMEEPDGLSYFMPHHSVYKPESTSTPLRIVFDCSCPSSSGFSLNDLLLKGASLQGNLLSILINFRVYPWVIFGDVRAMYRQIWVAEKHRRFQKILWRFHPEDELKVYQLNTVTFGVKSAPYLSQRVTRLIAELKGCECPLAAQVINHFTYMDDCIQSCPDESEAVDCFNQLVSLLKFGGFHLTKCCTNSSVLQQLIPPEDHLSPNQDVEFDNDAIGVLGMTWHPSQDVFRFYTTDKASLSEPCTKRRAMSLLARIFDPLGLISPSVVCLKLILKELWTLSLDWDDSPPSSISKQWEKFNEELPLISDLSFPRHSTITKEAKTYILGFADASSVAYGAAVYVWSQSSSEEVPGVRLLLSKSRIVPMKPMTIPRLELCAAHLLSKLLRFVVDIIEPRHHLQGYLAFSDSMTTLQWISSEASRWTTFIANRVVDIQAHIDKSHWFHIDGEINPADIISRSALPSALKDHSLWFNGPPWLRDEPRNWPLRTFAEIPQSPDEIGECLLVTTRSEENRLYDLICKVSNFHKLLRITAYVLRYALGKRRNKKYSTRLVGATEMFEAELLLIKTVQNIYFSEEIKSLQNNQICSPKLRKLSPFLHEGIIRVGGRLARGELSFDAKHPILLPKNDPYVHLLVDQYHLDNLHAGPNLVHSLLRQRYWFLAGRGVIRQRLHECNTCFRFRPTAPNPMMADLPRSRISEGKVFWTTGTDFCGPFHITMTARRGIRSQKVYVCLFICFRVKAVHLEVVSDLSTASFLCALKRFLARRGPCAEIYSDRGTNYVGANNFLTELYTQTSADEFESAVNSELAKRGIRWLFNCPSAPHQGGLWEANVKSMKTHLLKVVGDKILTLEEFNTLIAQIEAVLNSRPLTLLSTDPHDPSALTPSHFLTLQPLVRLPAYDYTDVPMNRLKRFELIDRLVQDYWNRWRIEYLHLLQEREKWNTPDVPIKKGMVVIIHQDNIPPLQWPLGVIEEVHPGPDGVGRRATVRTIHGTYLRPAVKLCPLPNQ